MANQNKAPDKKKKTPPSKGGSPNGGSPKRRTAKKNDDAVSKVETTLKPSEEIRNINTQLHPGIVQTDNQLG